MKFFLDTANLDELRRAMDMNLIDGATTNPSLVAKEGNVDFRRHIEKICDLVPGPVSVEVTEIEFDGMLREAREYRQYAPNVVIKCPLTPDGLRATRALSDEGTPVNVTLCFSSAQAILAAKAGASYISPFVGRLDDIAFNGMELIREIVAIYDNYDWQTQVLAASIRHPVHVVESALAGADVVTLPFKVIEQLFKHPLTDKGIEQFTADWTKRKAAQGDDAQKIGNSKPPSVAEATSIKKPSGATKSGATKKNASRKR